MAQFHTLTIQNIQRETDQCVTLSFTIPDNIKSSFNFIAGQYITLRTTINGNDVRRDYSLCSSPKSGDITVAVKEVENGLFSTYANKTLKVGDTLQVAEPKGRFTFKPNKTQSRTIAAFAAGSGITPIMSIAKTVLEEEPNSTFVLVYGNKTAKDTIFLNEILKLNQDHPKRFKTQFICSQSQETNTTFGRIEKSTVETILKTPSIDAFYLCGPEAMINTVKTALTENGIADDKINFELFTASTQSTDSAQPIKAEGASGVSTITVIVDDEEKTFELDQSKTILDAALAEDLDAPYSCQGGVCSSCIARVTEGNAVMRQNNILTESEIAEGLILTCQAHANSDKLVVDYDDV